MKAAVEHIAATGPVQRGSVAKALAWVADCTPAASGSVVMGTGIVSIALALNGQPALSDVLLVLAAVVWVALGLILTERALNRRRRLRQEARTPAALTGIAGTAVLGSRLALLGWSWAGVALLLAALAMWLALLKPVVSHRQTPTTGLSLMLTVSTESLAVLCAALAAQQHAAWLTAPAVALFVLGLGLYALVVARFDFHQLVAARGDHWITGGALAISTLAAGTITHAAKTLHEASTATGGFKTASLVLWALSIAWLPALIAAEILRPRLQYDLARWATVFPVGMYAACSFVVAEDAGAPAIESFARVWAWACLVAWALVSAGTIRHALRSLARQVTATAGARPTSAAFASRRRS